MTINVYHTIFKNIHLLPTYLIEEGIFTFVHQQFTLDSYTYVKIKYEELQRCQHADYISENLVLPFFVAYLINPDESLLTYLKLLGVATEKVIPGSVRYTVYKALEDTSRYSLRDEDTPCIRIL